MVTLGEAYLPLRVLTNVSGTENGGPAVFYVSGQSRTAPLAGGAETSNAVGYPAIDACLIRSGFPGDPSSLHGRRITA